MEYSQDSDDDDIFVLHQLKPVIPVTREQGLRIKNAVLSKLNSSEADEVIEQAAKKADTKRKSKKQRVERNGREDFSTNKSKLKHRRAKTNSHDRIQLTNLKSNQHEGQINGNRTAYEITGKLLSKNNGCVDSKSTDSADDEVICITDKEECENESNPRVQRRSLSCSSSNGTPRKKRKSSINSPNKSITDYFSPKKIKDVENRTDEQEKQDSCIASTSSESPVKVEIDVDATKVATKVSDVSASEEDPSGSIASAFCCQVLVKMINEEINKQLDLNIAAIKNQVEFEKLISDEEQNLIKTFYTMPDSAMQLYCRMLGRKKCWHRLSSIKYPDINHCLFEEYKILSEHRFFDVAIDNESLKVQLNLMKKLEVLNLCKLFNVPRNLTLGKREVLIDALIQNSRTQRSAMDAFRKKATGSRLDLLKGQVSKQLGPCFRLNPAVAAVFNRIILLSSLFHNVSEESKRYTEQYLMMLEVLKGRVKFMKYEVHPLVIFHKRVDVMLFEEAKETQVEFEAAVLSKNHTEFQSVAMRAYEKFKQLLKDNQYRVRVARLPHYLKRYSAGAVYASVLTKFCETFKKKGDPEQVVRVLKTLLDQQLFNCSKRGKWYELLVLAYESLKKNPEAARVVVMADRDEQVNEVQRLTLQIKSRTLLKRKTNGLKDAVLRERLDDFATTAVQEPSSIEIKGKAMDNDAGFKCVYVQEGASGTSYWSVEEQAIYHYKCNGFTEGLHVEGGLVHAIYFVLFFDIIYEDGPLGVFQSPYQEHPLDFNSKSFYENRKHAIDRRLESMDSWSHDFVRQTFEHVTSQYRGVKCVLSWSEKCTVTVFCDIIRCLGMPAVKAICTRLVKNYRVTRSGFPDLTLWNPETNRCKFVEVKSPNDKLSPNQRLWLDFLRNAGVDCEVCNVKNVGAKRIR